MIVEVPESARLEIKFCASQSEAGSVWRWLHFHKAAFRKAYPPRWVNNIYFDTLEYGAYQDNLAGARFRAKVRYRWYGESDHPGAGALEVKCKRNMFGWKIRHPVPSPPCEPNADYRTFLKGLLAQLPEEGRGWLRVNAFPILRNRYHRQYFVSRDGHLRATIDTRQSAWDLRFRPRLNSIARTDLPVGLVLEVKFDRHYRDQAAQLLADVPIRVSRHSKYVLGTQGVSHL